MYKKEKEVSINFSTIWDSDYWMKSNEMYCGFNMPPALISQSSGGTELTHGLPPYAKRKTYLADEYPACPKHWVPSEGRKTSYFVPVKENHGMWLDFNKNCDHKYEVAIVVSVQGINPITGMPCKDAGLEQYIDTCPKHNKPFGPNRYCSECGYKWPKQNYISTNSTPRGNLWLDGFRTAEGVVRQYILTMDKIKGVANNIIKEDRVFAIGISFFLSVNPKPVAMQVIRSRSIIPSGALCSSQNYYKGTTTNYSCDSIPISDSSAVMDWMECSVQKACIPTPEAPGAAGASSAKTGKVTKSAVSSADFLGLGFGQKLKSKGKYGGGSSCDAPDAPVYKQVVNSTACRSIDVKKVEVGAGANINQQTYDDPEPLEFWRKEPESVILINYALEEDCEKIIKSGKISLEGHKESFLKDIPVGNELVSK